MKDGSSGTINGGDAEVFDTFMNELLKEEMVLTFRIYYTMSSRTLLHHQNACQT